MWNSPHSGLRLTCPPFLPLTRIQRPPHVPTLCTKVSPTSFLPPLLHGHLGLRNPGGLRCTRAQPIGQADRVPRDVPADGGDD